MAVGITVFIGALQTGLIRPYYRNSKIQSVRVVADEIQFNLINSQASRQSVENALRQTVNNNACVVILNDEGNRLYSADSIGAGCMFQEPLSQDMENFFSSENMANIFNNDTHEYSQNFLNPTTGQEMIIYGRRVNENLGTFYLFVNSALEPVDSIVSFFTRQYGGYMLVAILIASFVAIYFSKKVTEPIVNMNEAASRLAKQDYSAEFSGGDFTETKELAMSLNEANEKLAKIDELRTDLIANVSHDIRTPITNIKAYAEMIKDISGDTPEKREKHLDVILKETDYMDRLVNDMTELSMMQSGNFIVNKDNFDLVDKIKEIIDVLQPLIEKSKVKVKCNSPESLTVYADEVKIGQVIANYLTNAIKHTPFNGTININAFALDDGETVRFEVVDEGEGVPEDEIDVIWDRYQKSSRSFSRNQTSTGLGLSIVKGIADAHGANYGVISNKGKGSIFYFELKESHEA